SNISLHRSCCSAFFLLSFFTGPATTDIYTLSLHDALPIYLFVLTSRELPNDIESFGIVYIEAQYFGLPCIGTNTGGIPEAIGTRSEEHTSELQSRENLVCRLLLEKKK